ncbi:PAS domain-containing protein [bacterium]|nr:MAG: PAS domain-containing protein [bacterium]
MNITDTSILVKALAATKSPVTITDNRLPDNPIVYCNAAFLELTEYTKEEVLGRNCRFLQGKHTDKQQIEQLAASIRNKQDSHTVLKNYTKSGRPFWNDLQVSPVYNDKAELTHFIGLQGDVTLKIEQEQAKARAKKLKLKNEMLQLEKLQLEKLNNAKNDFISVASHQLRTPATAVKQYLGMLEAGIYGELSESQLKAVKTAYESNDRQLHIIDKLLQIARIDAGKVTLKKERTDITAMIESIKQEFSYRLLHLQQSITYVIPDKHIYMSIDKQLLRTVFENIIDNAMKYSVADTTISISVEDFDDRTTIVISDQGIGMTKANVDKLFKKFTRIENSVTREIGGTGMGLYWVKKVLDLHSASITIESSAGKGTDFMMTFPKETQ